MPYKKKLDNKQQNKKRNLCSDRDEAIDHIISEYRKHVQKACKNRHDWVGKVIHWDLCNGLVGRVFANGPRELGSIPDCIIPKTLKMVLDTSLLNTQHYKVCIKGKVEQSWERSSTLPYISV